MNKNAEKRIAAKLAKIMTMLCRDGPANTQQAPTAGAAFGAEVVAAAASRGKPSFGIVATQDITVNPRSSAPDVRAVPSAYFNFRPEFCTR